jgi:hypothetical protein
MYQILLLLLMLTGCNLSQEATLNDYVPNQFTKADFAIYDNNDKSTLSIGMNREEVEKSFGKHTGSIDFVDHFIYDGFKVHYEDNKINAIIIDDNTNNNLRFQTVRNAHYGSLFSEIIEKYGQSGILDESAENISLTFIVEFENGEYVIKKSKTDVKDKANALTISANFYKKNTLSFLMIADYYYSYSES